MNTKKHISGLKWQPNEIMSPDTLAYCDTLGRSEWEWAAAHIVSLSQENDNTWTPKSDWRPNWIDELDDMVEAGMAVSLPSGYMLTNKALALIEAEYPTTEPE